MTKPSQRHSSHVQSVKAPAAETALPADAKAPAEPAPPIQSDKARGGLWLALVIWAFVFGVLFVYLLYDLFFSFFFR